MLTTVSREMRYFMNLLITTTKTFKGRLVEVIDQAQHFAALGPVGGGGGPTGDSAQAFREGLDVTERECEWYPPDSRSARVEIGVVFTLAQESSKRMKKWYEESERTKR